MPTILSLIKLAILSARKRAQLLFLLAVMAGLISSITLTPSVLLMEDIQDTVADAGEGQLNEASLIEMFADGIGTLTGGYIAFLVTIGALIPFWARASSPLHIQPWDGDRSAYARRAVLSFVHLLTATALSLLVLIILLLFTGAIGAALGGPNSFLIIVVITAMIWANILFSATANIAIIAASTDRKLPFAVAFSHIRLFMRPAVGSLAVFLFLSLIIENIFGSVIHGLVDGKNSAMLTSFVRGAIAFLSTALHISVLENIPALSSRARQD